MDKSIILNSEYIERDIKAVAALLDNSVRQLYEDGYIPENDYYALQMMSNFLSDDIAPRCKELINASYELLRKVD